MNFDKVAPEIKEKFTSTLSPELLEKLKACETPEEVMKLMSDNDIELDDDVMEMVAGGGGCFGCC